MPELPEVERAARRLRAAVVGRTIAGVRLLHPALRRAIKPAVLSSLRGHRIVRVDQRAKHQLLVLDDGRSIHAHFRMAGDWAVDRHDDELPRSARASVELDDGSRLLLVDPRALSTLTVLAPDATPFAELGPDPFSPSFEPALAAALARRRGPIKPALLDQRVAAGVGNIYAAEALWEARIDPRAPASSLTPLQVHTLTVAIREVLRRGRASRGRYRQAQTAFASTIGRTSPVRDVAPQSSGSFRRDGPPATARIVRPRLTRPLASIDRLEQRALQVPRLGDGEQLWVI